jgi:peptidoglycan/xylan/chitin deacetylase (PgdA/CDA1 family)
MSPTKKLCITIDLEPDFAGLIPETYESCDPQRLAPFLAVLRAHRVKLSVFVVGKMLDDRHPAVELLRAEGAEFHLHSYSHDLAAPNSQREIERAQEAFQRYFGQPARGYRAPQGLITPACFRRLDAAGFEFSASVFPSFWPRREYLTYPREPFMVEGTKLLEIPFATLPVRLIVSQSWLKLLGWSLYGPALRALPLPESFVFDSHLHDFARPGESVRALGPIWQRIMRRNREETLGIFERFLETMESRGYEFAYMSEVARERRESLGG